MSVGTALESNAHTTEVMQPGMRAFDDPEIFAKAAAMFGAALGDHRLDTAIAQRASMPLGVVTAIDVDHTRSLPRVAAQSANRRNRVDLRHQLRDIVDVHARQDRGERRTVGVGDDVALGTGGRQKTGPNTTDRARSRSGLLRAPLRAVARASDPTRRLLANRATIANMLRSSHPISASTSRQRSPVVRTNRIPVSTAQFETDWRPEFFSRRGLGGNSGSFSVHNSSSMNGLAICSVSFVPMPEVSSSLRRLTAPLGPIETVSKPVLYAGGNVMVTALSSSR